MNVTDAGLIHLSSLKRLEVLDLAMTKITDAGLVHLRGLVNPKRLSLRNTMIAKNASIGRLPEALPVVHIDF
jgi:internalin A